MSSVYLSVVRRLLALVLAASLAFFLLRLLPGDAISAQLATSRFSEAFIQERRTELGLEDPILTQYAGFLTRTFQGDFGTSLSTGQPVTDMIAQAFIPTLSLSLTAFVIASLIGFMIGTLSGITPTTPFGRAARLFSSIAISTPIYWTGTLAILVFSVGLRWFPSGGTGTLSHLLLPALILGFHASGAIAETLRANLRSTYRMDFVRTGHAKGLPPQRILTRHVLRVVLIPVVTVMALQAGFLLSGTVITELLFTRAGLGRLLLDSIMRRDYPVIQAIVLLSAFTITLLNFAADLLYLLLDPRLRDAA